MFVLSLVCELWVFASLACELECLFELGSFLFGGLACVLCGAVCIIRDRLM